MKAVFVIEMEIDQDQATLDTIPDACMKIKDLVLPEIDFLHGEAKALHVAIRGDADTVLAVFGVARSTWKPGARHFVQSLAEDRYSCLDCSYVGPWPPDDEACPGPE